jgi:predicted nucleic acid-binding protein
MRTIVFDNEAIQALTHSTHPKHRTVIAHLAGAVARRRRGTVVDTVVPTTVRVETGWDRTTPAAAAGINRFRLRDHVLDTPAANLAASIQRRCCLGPTEAHIGATARSVASGDVVVLTSDPTDIASACAPTTPQIVRI